ncbi:YwhD family protein [Alteribacillus iranensis]|uniref:YwhD family protein n=1 Tax=Alteribacillus iranensis TaxID=930128 RepID=A0A1I2C2H9_9BACI|nr:YwhD family protein [Alteribacillus iranensis]SFE62646.1 YwhD family protein [Alteribacillus iranensis]
MDKDAAKKNEEIKRSRFNILSGDSTDGHGGYGVGALSLDNVTPVIVDPEGDDAFIDMGALHARSAIEKRVRILESRDELPDSRKYWIVWVTVQQKEGKPHYGGVGACEFLVEREDKRIKNGYKSMPEHVNNMDKSLKGRVVVDHMDDHSKKILAAFLKGFNEDMWNHSTEELHQALTVK